MDNDVFGLATPTVMQDMTVPPNRAFAFPRTADKVQGFMEWLQEQVDRGILETFQRPQLGRGIEEAWTNVYIRSAYQQGVKRARQEMINAGYDVPPIEEGVSFTALLNQEMHADRLGVLYTRAFDELKGITTQMDTQISRVLTQGLAEGRNPREIANILTKTISGPTGDLGITDTLGRFIPAERRAIMLARTEIIRAHSQGLIREAMNWGVEGVRVKAEWVTAGYNVCPDCAALERKTFPLQEAMYLLPKHPNCRCSFIFEDITDKKSTERETIEVPEEPVTRVEEVYKWKRVANEEQAVAQTEKIGIANIVLNGEWKKKQMGIDRINDIGEELTRMMNERPKLAEFVTKQIKGSDFKITLMLDPTKTIPNHRRTAAYWAPKSKTIRVAVKNDVTGNVRVGSDVWSVDESVTGAVRHEFGHAVYDSLTKQQQEEWGKIESYSISKQISRYATTRTIEAFAEAFSVWTSKQYGKNGVKLPEIIERFFEEVFK